MNLLDFFGWRPAALLPPKGGASTQVTGYSAGEIGIQALIDAVPELKQFAEVSGEQVANIGSYAMVISTPPCAPACRALSLSKAPAPAAA